MPRSPRRVMAGDRGSPIGSDFANPVLIARHRPGKSASPCGNSLPRRRPGSTDSACGRGGRPRRRCENVRGRVPGEPNRAERRYSLPTDSSADQTSLRKKEGSAWNPIAAIIRHLESMHRRAERRNALRCSALHLLLISFGTREMPTLDATQAEEAR
jgi:hypothetical protein